MDLKDLNEGYDKSQTQHEGMEVGENAHIWGWGSAESRQPSGQIDWLRRLRL